MAYIEKRYRTGNVTEVIKYHDNKHKGKLERQPRQQLTTEQQRERNKRAAIRNLAREINANFKPGDYSITLTNLDDIDQKTANKRMKNFIDRLRRSYKKQGIEFKYIYVTEVGKTGKKKVHHHLLLPFADSREISRLWGHGYVRFSPLDETGQYKNIAAYMLKKYSEKPKGSRTWAASKNIIKPEPQIKEISAKEWRQEPKPLPGYYIDELYNGISEETGWGYQYYSMVKLPAIKKRE